MEQATDYLSLALSTAKRTPRLRFNGYLWWVNGQAFYSQHNAREEYLRLRDAIEWSAAA